MKWVRSVKNMGASFWAEQDGPTVTEYAVLLVLIILGVVLAGTLIGEKGRDTYKTLTNGLPVGS